MLLRPPSLGVSVGLAAAMLHVPGFGRLSCVSEPFPTCTGLKEKDRLLLAECDIIPICWERVPKYISLSE